jgi:tetratricopeptide (TPR) repeat protein
MKLAPNRPEPEMMLSQLDLYQGNTAEAQALLQNVVNNIPQDMDAKLQLGLVYSYTGQTAQALQIAEPVLASGYVPTHAEYIAWMGDAYQQEGNYAAAANIYQILTKMNPGDFEDLWSLAQVDTKIGKTAQAIAIAQSLIKSDPPDAAHFQDFINSLK